MTGHPMKPEDRALIDAAKNKWLIDKVAHYAPKTTLTLEQVEAGCRAMHDCQGTGDADALMHHPAQKSWEEPTEPRWSQWIETVGEVYAATDAARAEGRRSPGDLDREARELAEAMVSFDVQASPEYVAGRVPEIITEGAEMIMRLLRYAGRDEAALPEAVAWRWRLFHPNSASGPIWGPWYVGPSKPEFRADIRSEVEPLYAAPPPPPVAELPGDVETLVTALNGLRAEWHRQAEAYEKDSKKSEPATNREMARSYSALLDRVASDLKLTITCATQASRAPTETGEGR